MVKGMDAITLNREFWLLLIFKSPRYTGGDFMFLYRFVRRRRCRSRRRHRRRPRILVHTITFEQLFGFLSFLARLLTYRLPGEILVDFRRDLDLEFSRSNWEFAISQPKMVRMPRNEKKTHRLNSRPQMWPSGLTLAMTLTLNFQGQIWNLLYLSQKWCNLPRNEKKTHRLISRPQMWPSGLTLAMTVTLNFQSQIWNWLYLCQKWSDCHETKSKHIDWTSGFKCDYQIWPWPWPWPWIFKVKYEICDISTKSGPIATKRKANTSIWTLGLKCDHGLDLGHDLDIWIFKVICDLDHLVTKVRWKDQFFSCILGCYGSVSYIGVIIISVVFVIECNSIAFEYIARKSCTHTRWFCVCYALIPIDYFSCIGAIIRLPQCPWSKWNKGCFVPMSCQYQKCKKKSWQFWKLSEYFKAWFYRHRFIWNLAERQRRWFVWTVWLQSHRP